MSIIDAHWTDEELTEFAQANFDKYLKAAGVRENIWLEVRSFFLNDTILKCGSDPSSPEDGIRQKLNELLPKHILKAMAPDTPRYLLRMGEVTYMHGDRLCMVLSRPDPAMTSQERLSEVTAIAIKDLAIDDRAPIYAYDNLSLLARIYEIITVQGNGGIEEIKGFGRQAFLKYTAMIGARRRFGYLGGDADTLALHEAAAHVSTFTNGLLATHYLGFMNDFRLLEGALPFAVNGIFERLEALQFTKKTMIGTRAYYAPMLIDQLLPGMATLLQEYKYQITKENGEPFQSFYKKVTQGRLTSQDRNIIDSLTPGQIVDCTKYFMALQTLSGLKTLMGHNLLKYMPQRGPASFDRVQQLLGLKL